jgi:tetratricopeptide (TPR) repeat protein
MNDGPISPAKEFTPVPADRLEYSTPGQADPGGDARERLLRGGIIGLMLVLFLAVLGVIFALPKLMPHDQPPAPASVSSNPAPAAPTVGQEPAREAAGGEVDPELRVVSQALLAEVLGQVDELEAKRVQTWASKDYAHVQKLIADGEAAYRQHRFADTVKEYGRAKRLLEAIGGRVETVLTETLDAGFLAIDSEDSAGAKEAFEFALVLEPDHEQARRGLGRAETLDEVVALVREAEGYERLGDSHKALSSYQRALGLDSEAPGAAAAVSRIERDRAEARFKALMSEGMNALDAGSFKAARSAFLKARKIKPRAAEISDAMMRLVNEETTYQIATLLAAARELERSEKWRGSAEKYAAMLELDADVADAGERRNHARRRAALDERLKFTIANPDRIIDDGVHAEALKLLDTAKQEPEQGPRLRQQVEKLAEVIRVARTPITVRLNSDDLTEVTILRVRTLGHFQEHTVTLLPGNYTAVGQREGFRDVRVVFKVAPNQTGSFVTVVCDENLSFGS